MKTLSQQIDDKLTAAAADRRRERSTRADPRTACEAGESATRREAEAAGLVIARTANVETAVELEKLAAKLQGAEHQSRERSASISRMQEAAMWLQREAGDAPQRNIPSGAGKSSLGGGRKKKEGRR